MDVTNVQKIKINLNHLKDAIEELQSGEKRDSARYKGTVLGITDALNDLDRGVITKIDVNELLEQLGHLLYFSLKNCKQPVPFDIEMLEPLKSHFKNPAIIVLKRIRRFLMALHRKILAELEEDQAHERRLDFTIMDLNVHVKNGLREMQVLQNKSSRTPSVPRKLDILTKALHVPVHFYRNFRLFNRILDDSFHLRNLLAVNWLAGSVYRGSATTMRKVSRSCLDLLDKKSKAIYTEMEKLSGIPFERNVDLEPGFTWFSLGSPLRRGEEFVRIFENEEYAEAAIKRLTYFMVRSAWNADIYRDQIDRNLPSRRDLQEKITQLCKIYSELEQKISESTNPGGEVQRAIASDISLNLLTEEEAEEARTWVCSNKARLQEMKLEVFQIIGEEHEKDTGITLPEYLEAMFHEQSETHEGPAPKISILALHRDMELMDQRLVLPDSHLLRDLCALKRRIAERKGQLEHVDYQRQVRAGCKDFKEFEEKLQEFEKIEVHLGEMHIRVDTWILSVWREVMFSELEAEIIDQGFAVVMDHMLAQIKILDYSVIDAKHFREYFELALILEDQEVLFQLDQLLHEIHSIPTQNQILPALADWENILKRADYDSKQTFIMENELQLQTLVDEVRAELRERIGRCRVRPRRLRFEIFSLADCYAGNLRSLLKGLLRMAPKIASEREGERLIANIQAIEAQVIEAQRVTKPNGDAYTKLNELKRLGQLPEQVLTDLHEDLQENFKDLDTLLGETNGGLGRVRRLQNRFGGDHDTSYLDVIINIHDLESLKEIYHFVDAITMTDIKRFGVIYKQKNALMADLFRRAYENDPSVPPNIAARIGAKVYKAFKGNNVVPIPLKTEILKEMPEILEFECELLIRTLNLVSSLEVRNKAVYRSIILVVEQARNANRARRLSLRRIWIKFRNSLLNFEPRNFKANFDNNTRAMITDVQNSVGKFFENL